MPKRRSELIYMQASALAALQASLSAFLLEGRVRGLVARDESANNPVPLRTSSASHTVENRPTLEQRLTTPKRARSPAPHFNPRVPQNEAGSIYDRRRTTPPGARSNMGARRGKQGSCCRARRRSRDLSRSVVPQGDRLTARTPRARLAALCSAPSAIALSG